MGSVTIIRIIRIMAGFALAGFIIGLSAAIVGPAFGAMLAMFFSVGCVLWGPDDGQEYPDDTYARSVRQAVQRSKEAEHGE